MEKLEQVQSLVKDYLSTRKWQEIALDGKLSYVKNNSQIGLTEFKPSPNDTSKKRIFLEDYFKNMGQYFTSHNYKMVPSISVDNPREDTLFTSAGVQTFNISATNLEGDLFLNQPVIRTQYFGSAKVMEGSSTSFVNVCTEKAGAQESDFVRMMDSWLNYLSSSGLYVGDFRLDINKKISNWGKGEFNSLVIPVRYRGLEIGDFGYLQDVTINGEKTNICDMGFGLERLAWAVNKTPSYYDVLWPGRAVYPADKHQLDIIRTVTLIAGSGIKPENNHQGYRLRKFLKEFDGFEKLETHQLVKDFYEYWKNFITLEKDFNSTFEIISEELNRNRNLNLLTSLNLPNNNVNTGLNPNSFVKELLTKQLVKSKT